VVPQVQVAQVAVVLAQSEQQAETLQPILAEVQVAVVTTLVLVMVVQA
jgi:hypothetical protein